MSISQLARLLILLCLMLAACTPSATPAAKPTEAAKPAAAPTAAPAAAANAEWDRVVAAAKQEGKVVVVGTTTDRLTSAITGAVQTNYGIEVEYVGPSSRE